MPSEELFGTRLRTEREKRGVSLQVVAQHTKVNRSLFAEMERGRFDQWPPGLFGRAFMRGYAEAVGLDADAVVAEYLELNRVDEESRPEGMSGVDEWSGDVLHEPDRWIDRAQADESSDGSLRLMLVEDGAGSWRRVTSHRYGLKAAAATFDAALVLVPAVAAALLVPDTTAWVIVSLVGLTALVAATAVMGGSPGLRVLVRRGERAEVLEGFEEPAGDLFLSRATRFGIASETDDVAAEPDNDDSTDLDRGPGQLVVSPNFYRPSDGRRFGYRARHA